MLYFLAWLYPDLIKAGELVGLTALELGCGTAIYGNRVKGRRDRTSDFSKVTTYLIV